MDLALPDQNGIEVIKSLRGRTRIPLIVLSGSTAGADKVAALDGGADDYIAKPFDAASYLRSHLLHLRQKLETNLAAPRHLLTEPGMGFRFRP